VNLGAATSTGAFPHRASTGRTGVRPAPDDTARAIIAPFAPVTVPLRKATKRCNAPRLERGRGDQSFWARRWSRLPYYLATGQIWSGGPAPQVNDPTYVSVIEELREQGTQSNGTPVGDEWEIHSS
jgi:hypothetical protein